MTHRVFAAVPLDVFRAEVSLWMERLRLCIPSGVKWVLPAHLHVTFHFFAAVTGEELEKIRKILQAQIPGFQKLNLGLSGFGAFPDLSRPEVLWAGIKGDLEVLGKIHESLQTAFHQDGLSVDARPFHPHLTVGRGRRGFLKLPSSIPELEIGPRPIEQVVLMESFLSREGPHYEIIQRIPLS